MKLDEEQRIRYSNTMTAPDEKHHEAPEYDYSLPQVKTLLSWTAPGRPFRRRAKEFYLNGLLILIFLEVIFFLFNQGMLMLVPPALFFVTFALTTVPPRNFHYRLSTEGVTIEDHFYLWEELYDFYFKKREGVHVLHIRTHAILPGELTLTLGDISEEHARQVLLPFLPFREVIQKTFMDKAAHWLEKTFPLERQHPTS